MADPSHLSAPSIARRTARCVLLGAVTTGLLGCTNGGLDPAGAIASAFPQPPTPSEAVAMMFDREDADQRREGINWLSAAPFGGEEAYVESYRLFFNDPDPSVRAACAQALGQHGSVDDANLLIVMLGDENPQVRWQAANGLRKIHNPAAIEPLTALTNDQAETNADVRQAAADALGQYADLGVFNALARALEDRNYAVIAAAHRSLVTLTGHDAGLDPRDWAEWSGQNAGNLFAGQQVYTFAPYQKPRGWTDTVRFWREVEELGPQQPTGLEVAGG